MNSKELLGLLGGEQNIISVSHCISRLRFVLRDESLADKEAIEKLSYVKGIVQQSGQFQIIIGMEVEKYYKDFLEKTNLTGDTKDELKEKSKVNMNPFQKFAFYVSGIFIPILPVIVTGGMILGVRNFLAIPIFDGVSLMEQNVFWEGTYNFLWLIAEAVFHFLPVYITWSTFKKIGGTPVIGIALGIMLVSPQLLNSYAVSTATEIPFWDFGFTKINMIGYQGQVLPALAVGVFGAYLEIFLKKHITPYLHLVLVPLLVILPTIILAHGILGPVTWQIGDWLASGIIFMFENLGALGGFIFGLLYAPLVITGVHQITLAIEMQLVSSIGGTYIFPIISTVALAQGAATLGFVLGAKSAKYKEIGIPGVISGWLGVIEPALFGVNLKFSYPFLIGCLGSALAGAWCMLTNVLAVATGAAGLAGVLSIQSGSIINYLIGAFIAVGFSLLGTYLITVKRRKSLNLE